MKNSILCPSEKCDWVSIHFPTCHCSLIALSNFEARSNHTSEKNRHSAPNTSDACYEPR